MVCFASWASRDKQFFNHFCRKATERQYRKTIGLGLGLVEVVTKLDDGWAAEGEKKAGYQRIARRQYQRSDLWFCLAPALSMLVPGASIWRIAFFSIIESSRPWKEQPTKTATVFCFKT
jgi:hypothetical protein